jgi:uncharacterized protein YyaL (SSP411 family)
MMTANTLDKSLSPYVLQHKDNPVAWQPWSDAVLAQAKESGKPVFLSIGYSGCHWCHVMNKQSFSDPETAALINENFIPVIVDREERPDIDQLFQAASTIMGHSGGWPLNVFLNTEGEPFFVAGYLPREERADQPAFKRVLNDMKVLFNEKSADATRNSSQVMQQLNNAFNGDARGSLESIQIEMAAVRIGQRYDIFMGGLIGTQKFPTVPLLEALWRAYLRNGLSQFIQLVSSTMNNILMGGLYDHVGGGFFRYTTDERWLVPHFEKTLSDNAVLLGPLTSMWQFNRNELCRQRVLETIGWLTREMQLEGAFACGLAPDTDGEDGRYYIWSEPEIDAALQGTFSARFKQVYGVKRDGDFNGKNILRRFANIAPPTEADEALMAKQRSLLLAVRDARPRPERDDKILADWNGLAIRNLAFAGSAFDRSDWVTLAINAFEAVIRLLGDGDFLHHAWANGQRGPRGYSDDYVHMASAALQLYESTGDKRFVEQAQKWVATLDAHFWDDVRGGYYFTAHDAEKLLIRTRMIFDQPTPSSNSEMISVLTRLALLTGENDYGQRAQNVATAFAGEFGRSWLSCGEYLNGFETFATGLQMVVVGKSGSAATRELLRAIWGKAMPNHLVVTVESTDQLPANHPAFGKPMENGQATVYICQRGNCGPAITSAVALSQALTLPQQRAAGAA